MIRPQFALACGLILSLGCTVPNEAPAEVVAHVVGEDFGAVRPKRPVHTYSVVAREPNTGDLGVAVQSHWFCVGSSVTWAEVGAP